MRATIAALTPDVPDETMLTTGDVAAILAICRSKAAELLSTAEIPGAVRVGNKYRIPAGVIRAWLGTQSLPQNRDLYDLRASLRSNKKIASEYDGAPRSPVVAHPVTEESTWNL